MKDLTASGYVHPAAKQCTWTPDLSNYATKADLEEVAAPKVIGSGSFRLVMNGDDKAQTRYITQCDYVIFTVTNDNGRQQELTIYKGSRGNIPGWSRDSFENYAYDAFSYTFNSTGTVFTFTGRYVDDFYAIINYVCYT